MFPKGMHDIVAEKRERLGNIICPRSLKPNYYSLFKSHWAVAE